MLSVNVFPANNDYYYFMEVDMYAANWQFPIQGRWFPYEVKVVVTYKDAFGVALGDETLISNSPLLNNLWDTNQQGAGLGWTRTTSNPGAWVQSAVTYGYTRLQAGNGDNTAWLNVAGTSSPAVTIRYVPIVAAAAAIRVGDKPGIYIQVKESSASSDDPADRFTDTHCSILHENTTLVEYRQAVPAFQNNNILGMWAVLEQNLTQNMLGLDARCSSTINTYNNCQNKTPEQALANCLDILDNSGIVRCLVDASKDPFGLFADCLQYVCSADTAACLRLKAADAVCNGVGNNPFPGFTC